MRPSVPHPVRFSIQKATDRGIPVRLTIFVLATALLIFTQPVWSSGPAARDDTKGPCETQTPTTTFPLIDGVTCFGTLSASTDTSDMPNGDFVATGEFYCTGNRGVDPASEKAGPIRWTLGFSINAACTDLDLNGQPGPANFTPCGQTLYATGGFIPVKLKKGPSIGTMTVTFSDAPPMFGLPAEPQGADPFDGCSATFESYPDRMNSSSHFALTGLTGNCKMAGSHITMSCRLE